MEETKIVIDGKTATGVAISLLRAPLVLAHGEKGFVMCGYLNVTAADRLGVPAAMVKGVGTVAELLAASVVDVSQAAAALGVKPGMTGREALQRFV